MKLGIIGMGNIGRQVAKRARAFDAVLQYYDKYHPLTPTEEEALEIRAVPMEELLRTSDVVTLHVPLTRETRGIIGRAELAMMKPTPRRAANSFENIQRVWKGEPPLWVAEYENLE